MRSLPTHIDVRKRLDNLVAAKYKGIMNLDPQICYQIMKSRDARFDGRFFSAVLTTDIYCRPGCPARMPKPENVRFVASAAAAEEAGFRPCLRCRPETSPGTPAWLGTSATVSRAMRLIHAGFLDENSVEELADKLGVGTRHLHRLFVEHLGAPPVVLAQTKRLHFARNLLEQTKLSMTEVALASGFGSLRRFNASLRKTYGKTPTELRRSFQRRGSAIPSAGLQLRLSFRPPYNWKRLIEFLRVRAVPGMEAVEAGCYRRTIAMHGAAGTIEVRQVEGKNFLLLRLRFPVTKGLAQIVERVRRLFDLQADPVAIADHLQRDNRLKELVQDNAGLRIPGAWDGFELAVRAILGQQVTVAAATTMARRLVEIYGETVLDDEANELTHLFPTPDVLAQADFNGVGLTAARVRTIRDLAFAVRDGQLSFEASHGLDDAVRDLLAIRGIGPWTAHYIAMRALGEPDAFPAADVGLRRAMSKGERLVKLSDVAGRAEVWRPWRAYAAMYLWASLGAPQE